MKLRKPIPFPFPVSLRVDCLVAQALLGQYPSCALRSCVFGRQTFNFQKPARNILILPREDIL